MRLCTGYVSSYAAWVYSGNSASQSLPPFFCMSFDAASWLRLVMRAYILPMSLPHLPLAWRSIGDTFWAERSVEPPILPECAPNNFGSWPAACATSFINSRNCAHLSHSISDTITHTIVPSTSTGITTTPAYNPHIGQPWVLDSM